MQMNAHISRSWRVGHLPPGAHPDPVAQGVDAVVVVVETPFAVSGALKWNGMGEI
jgi:hypothetical protein